MLLFRYTQNFVLLSLLILLLFSEAVNGKEPDNGHGAQFYLDENPPIGLLAEFKGSQLCQVAQGTHQYLVDQAADKFAVHQGSVFEVYNQKLAADKTLKPITLDRVKATLAFICQTYREDVRAKRQSRLHDEVFLKQHFDFIRWLPDRQKAQSITQKSQNAVKNRMLNNIPKEQIFLTKYYTKLLTASSVKTEAFDQALYAIPFDEKDLTLAQAQQLAPKLNRFKYTRQQVIAGALEKPDGTRLAKPLVWISEEALHDVLLQGTGVLNVDGKIRYFNVHRNNGIAYDYSIGKRDQARYWYFIETPSIMGYGHDQQSKISIAPQVSLAGNVAELGLGKLFMLSYAKDEVSVSRLAVLADQGGAFDNNLFQLDLLVDSYRGWQDYHQANKDLPDYASAWLLMLK